MVTIVLISCVSKKLAYKAKAKDLYTSPLFKYSLKYAKSFTPDKIFILSAKYGLLELEKEVEPYKETLSGVSRKQRAKKPGLKVLSKEERKHWGDKVSAQLNKVIDVKRDEVIFLAGERYREHLLPHITNYKIPLKGLSIGKQLKFLKEKTSNERKL